MRPSYGRVSRYGAMAIAYSMDRLGPMARTADCCGLVLSVIAGHDPKDHHSLSPSMSSFSYDPKHPRNLFASGVSPMYGIARIGLEQAVDDALRVLEKRALRFLMWQFLMDLTRKPRN